MIYCDTSVLVAAFTKEARTPELLPWLRGHADQIVLSDWVETEFASAVALKERTKALSREEADGALASYRSLAQGVQVEEIARRHFALATSLILKRVTGLRSPDALHLAITITGGFEMATLDQLLADTCAQEHVPTHLLA